MKNKLFKEERMTLKRNLMCCFESELNVLKMMLKVYKKSKRTGKASKVTRKKN